MKVLMLSWEYPPHVVGGLGKHVTELVPALAEEDVEVHLIVPRWVGGQPEEAIASASGRGQPGRASTVYRIDPPVGPTPNFYVSATRANAPLEAWGRQLWQERGPFDVIHAHDWLVAPAAVALKHAFKAPLVTTIHATEYGRGRGAVSGEVPLAIHNVEWWLTYESWRVICCSAFMAGEVETAHHVPADKVDVIPNGVDPTRFDTLDGEDLAAFRAGFAAPDEKIVFYVGRVVQEKGVHLLVEAMSRILAQRPDVKLVVAGTGGYLGAVRQRAIDLGVGASCYFTGFIADSVRDRLFRVADVAAFPSLYEPFGIVALEAMAAKTPVVVSEIGGLAEVVEHAETGITVFPDSVDSLVWGILHTLDHPEWAEQRAANAYRLVLDEYNWQAIARKTIEVYQRVATERRDATWE
ncbi:MAG: glycosyltransferase family 4 protein [Chloroflexota bacterium]